MQELDETAVYLAKLRDGLIAGVRESITDVFYTGHPEKRLPGHASFCFEGIEGEALVFMLSSKGIYANTGSACASKALKTSRSSGPSASSRKWPRAPWSLL